MRTCLACGADLTKRHQKVYCSVACQRARERATNIARWLATGVGEPAGNHRHYIRLYLFEGQGGLCAICACPAVWNGLELRSVLDHISGDASDNRRENLRLICPNCDSQLPTYKSRNRGRAAPGASSATPTASPTDGDRRGRVPPPVGAGPYGRPMAEIVLFHHALGLTPGVQEFAGALQDLGHTVHTPDLFEGRLFDVVEDGVAFAAETGRETLGARATAAVEVLPPDVVYAGMSMGCAYATQLLLTRPGGRAAFYLYGAVDPAWWEATWPPGVPAQAHQTADDPWREKEAEDAFVAKVPGAELFVYDGATHLFADPSTDDFDATAAALAMERIQAFLGALG
jgi:dienelactone hydrolase